MLEVIGVIAARLQPRPSGDMRWFRRVSLRLNRIVMICLALVAQMQYAGYAARSGAGG